MREEVIRGRGVDRRVSGRVMKARGDQRESILH